MPYIQEAYRAADEIIEKLKKQQFDYTAHREEIARCFDEGIFSGNWDYTTDIGVDGVRELRFIQEDEYDQHMDEDDDKPSWDDMLFQADAYVWFA